MSQMHALLIGINNYKAEKLRNYSLHGCLNDIQRMSDLLAQRYGERLFLTVLAESAATKAGIVDAFREKLILPAQTWSESGRPEPAPAFVFHFSGHGSQARDLTGTKPSGFDETIVPFDSRQGEIFDLRDWELGALIDELGQYTSNITIFLDCCHAGSGTRSSGRAIEPDLRIPSGQAGSTARPVSFHGLRSTSEIRIAEYVLIAACDATQIAQEYHEQLNGNTKIYGAMTYALTEILGDSSVPRMTYRDLHARLCSRVQIWYPSQQPQCEGDRDRWLFETHRAQRELPFRISAATQEDCLIDGGRIHGFYEGDEFDVFPPDTYTLLNTSVPTGRIRIQDAGVMASQCVYVLGDRPATVGSRISTVKRTGKRANAEAEIAASNQEQAIEWQRKVLAIRNLHDSPLAGHVSCEIKTLVESTSRLHREASHRESVVYEAVSVDADGMRRIVSGTSVCFSVSNSSDRPLYIQILSLGYDGSISRIWPRLGGEQTTLSAGRTFETQRFRLKFHPRDVTTKAATEHVKVFAATLPFEVDSLCTGHRSTGRFSVGEAEWTTAELSYAMIRDTKSP